MPEPFQSVQNPDAEPRVRGAPTVGVVLSTYDQSAYLRMALEAYAGQTRRPDRIFVADDGSGDDTARAVRDAANETGLRLVHLWHPDRGFRKSEILNRAIVAATEEILVFSDGDCLPRADYVETHVALSQPGRFVSGGYLKLSAQTSRRVTREAIREGRVLSYSWLRARGWWPGRRLLRLLPAGPTPALLDRLTTTKATWNGHSASTFRKHLLEVNGFDNDMAYGGQDRALGERLANAGLRGIQARHRLPLVHLDHGRPYADPEVVRKNRETRRRIRREREKRARLGIAELEPDPELRVEEL